ncbi:universal stress protein [Enterococcus haemoperoxidus ATCC BAA-382]|uniref:Universal stress protein n=1 Tax=Enterococcus haemoperoxidus ATCC BAA-382 TaxID=1158608 RepID=R2QXN3_9ENTE|nr:universal stress protein [Enterococcus haemoperoxidus]EOI00141.1 universal stress protein [Enterococcus haemoperoxidus ATCC BAA-382]EOT59621.1 universal stress protein [Enterococcus haemoperoxidus ATCC BAA-382]OJG52458.1 universal stress protein [Enterococcus haemoperoxidus]
MGESYKNILVAVDGSDQSEKAFQEAIKIAKRNDAALHVLSVIEEMGNYFGELTMSMGTLMEDLRTREEEEMKERESKALEQGVSQVFTYVMYGYPKTLIADFTESKEPIDLIVIGRTGLNGFERLMVGSTTSYVVNHTKANVLVVNNVV